MRSDCRAIGREKAAGIGRGVLDGTDAGFFARSLTLHEMLTIMKGKRKLSPNGLVFGPYRYEKAFWTAREKAGLGEDVVFHSLRHTFVSRLVRAGVDIRTVQELAGHKEIKMTMRYSHRFSDQKRLAIEKMENKVTANLTTVGDHADTSPCAPVAQMDRASVS